MSSVCWHGSQACFPARCYDQWMRSLYCNHCFAKLQLQNQSLCALQAFAAHVALLSAVAGTVIQEEFSAVFVDIADWLTRFKEIQFYLLTLTGLYESPELVRCACIFQLATLCLRWSRVCYFLCCYCWHSPVNCLHLPWGT